MQKPGEKLVTPIFLNKKCCRVPALVLRAVTLVWNAQQPSSPIAQAIRTYRQVELLHDGHVVRYLPPDTEKKKVQQGATSPAGKTDHEVHTRTERLGPGSTTWLVVHATSSLHLIFEKFPGRLGLGFIGSKVRYFSNHFAGPKSTGIVVLYIIHDMPMHKSVRKVHE